MERHNRLKNKVEGYLEVELQLLQSEGVVDCLADNPITNNLVNPNKPNNNNQQLVVFSVNPQTKEVSAKIISKCQLVA